MTFLGLREHTHMHTQRERDREKDREREREIDRMGPDLDHGRPVFLLLQEVFLKG